MAIVALSNVYLMYVSKPMGGIQSNKTCVDYEYLIMTSQSDDVLVILTPFFGITEGFQILLEKLTYLDQI